MTQARNATINPSREESNHTLNNNTKDTDLHATAAVHSDNTIPDQKSKWRHGQGVNEKEDEE